MNPNNENNNEENSKKVAPEILESAEDNQSKSAPENRDRLPENAENAVPPKAWENQKKAYDDAWKNNKIKILIMIFRFPETKKIPLLRWNFYLKLIQ